MSRSVDLENSAKTLTEGKTGTINVPDEMLEMAKKAVEARKKKEAQKAQLDKKIESLKKIEKKTEKLLKKAKAPNKTPTTRNQPVNKASTTPVQNKREVSFLTLKMMPPKKTPRKILEHIRSNAFKEKEEWFSTIDSYELASLTGKTSDQNGTTVRRLRDQGWFEIVKADSGGFRLLKIDPENYGLNP